MTNTVSNPEQSVKLAKIAAAAAVEKLGQDLIAFDVHENTIIADVFLLVSGESAQQVRAIVNEIDEALSKAGHAPSLIEGTDHYRWVLMQADGLIVHVFDTEQRSYYQMEKLWRDCPEVELPDFEEQARAAAAAARAEHAAAPREIIGL